MKNSICSLIMIVGCGVILISCSSRFESANEVADLASLQIPPGDRAKIGEKIYNDKCVGCHHPLENSTIRGTKADRINYAFTQITPMKPFNFNFTSSEVDGLVEYLAFKTGIEAETCSGAIEKTEMGMLTPVELANTLMDIFFLTKSQVDSLSLASSAVGGGMIFDNHATLQRMTNLMMGYFEVTPAIVNYAFTAKYNTTYCRDSEAPAACAKRLLTDVAYLAYRHPPTAEDVDKLTALFATAPNFEAGIKLALRGILLDPRFLLKFQSTPLSSFDIASRLSFALLRTSPDATLLAKAANQTITQPSVLEAEIDRLLANPKSSQYEKDFVIQWLDLDRLADAEGVDVRYALKETELFFANIRGGLAPVSDILSAKYSFINGPLATVYNVPGVSGTDFNKVNFPSGLQRQGLLGQASFLRNTSVGTRTSPVIRGEFVRAKFLCLAVDEAPGDAPKFPEEDLTTKSIREVLKSHEDSSTNCYSCHSKMDPYGWPLEYFGTDGGFRTRYSRGGFAVDGHSDLSEIGGGPVTSPLEYMTELDRSIAVKGCLVEKQLQFAINRSLSENEKCHARNIAREILVRSGTYAALVKAIVMSPVFKGQ